MLKPKVAVCIFVHKVELEWFEIISLIQCEKILHNYQIFLVHPKGLDVSEYHKVVPDLKYCACPPRWFKNLRSYNRMKIHPGLYKMFIDYEFMLTYELDSFVFKDALMEWCTEGWDYIGAPWYEGIYNVDDRSEYKGVGNSGFSLRKISSCIRVLNDPKFILPIEEVWKDPRREKQPFFKSILGKCLNSSTRNHFHWLANSYQGNEDFFWGLEADKRFEWWRTADFDAASKFSFEANAPKLFSEVGGLPFGCHKWDAVHQDFWRSHLEACGFELPESYGR